MSWRQSHAKAIKEHIQIDRKEKVIKSFTILVPFGKETRSSS